MKEESKVNTNKIIHTTVSLVLLLVSLVYSMNLYADPLMVEERVVVQVPAKTVWALIGGFQALDRWHPAVVESTLLGTGKNTGDIRVLTIIDGAKIVEKLEWYNESAMSFQYAIVDSPLPIENYHAVLSVKSIAGNETEVIWQSNFEAVGVSNDEAKKIISDIYLAGLNALITLYK